MQVLPQLLLWTALRGQVFANPIVISGHPRNSDAPGSNQDTQHTNATDPQSSPISVDSDDRASLVPRRTPRLTKVETDNDELEWRFAYKGDWVNKSCADPHTDSRYGTWWEAWTYAEVPTAWSQLFHDFKEDTKKQGKRPLSLDSWIWDVFWQGDPYCRLAESHSCAAPTCVPEVLPAAAIYIMKSIANANQFVHTFVTQFQRVVIIEMEEIQEFVETFTDRNPHMSQEAMKMMIDGITMLVGFASASLWNDVFKEAKIFPQYLKKMPGVKAPKPDRKDGVRHGDNGKDKGKAKDNGDMTEKNEVKDNGKGRNGMTLAEAKARDKNEKQQADVKKAQDVEDAKAGGSGEGNERSVYKDVSNAAIAWSFIEGKDSMTKMKDPLPDVVAQIRRYAASYFNTTTQTMVNQLEKMMWANDSKSQHHVYSMLADGGMLNLSNTFLDDGLDKIKRRQTSLLWNKLLPEVWRLSDKTMYPFILRAPAADWKCGKEVKDHGGKVTKKTKWNMGLYMDEDTNVATRVCDNEDNLDESNTFWLLNANYEDWDQRGAYPFTMLKGGNRASLNGQKWPIHIEDVVASTYAGFLQHGKRNGYEMPSSSSLVVTNGWHIKDFGWPALGHVRTPGFFNLTVCLDPQEAEDRIKKGIKPPCGETPEGASDVEGKPNDAGYIAGWCTIHITQFKPNLKGNKGSVPDQMVNPIKGYQIAVALYEGGNKPLVFASKQPVDGTLAIKSKLPHMLYVQDNYKDENGDDLLAFWYNDQFWLQNNTKHQSTDADKAWDGLKREFTTGFTCKNPDEDPKKDPPVPVPKNAVPAYYGTTEPKLATDVKKYKKGTCMIHIREYQQHEMKNALNPGIYAMEITIWDDDKNLIAYTPKANKPPGIKHTVDIKGPLPYIVMCWLGTEDGKGDNDKAKPGCKYADQKFMVDAHSSGWHGGLRDSWQEFDC
ncbi:hypothetical protein N7492_004511 [Penicillium capsulatum]|uniref:Uncharacterized protein n=1 Tax=Penicillium capsulatum TaxID=69766 RepID=A0A9W9IA56_9EURO|nr:hypothetical protein N7492_004511 [Penicillium capsulatum]KAJ6136369.1 hypothetical protein N7512_001529 [Penicillium capsulatum]